MPRPILFNTWKHHAGCLRQRVRTAIEGGAEGVAELALRLPVLGTNLMDWYVGELWPRALGGRILELLRAEGREPLVPFREWVEAGDGYRVVTLEDGSRWVLGLGDVMDRYVHLHPGRWSPHTLRVKAPVLKTAVVALAHAGVHGGEPTDRGLINEVRRLYLGLPPLGSEPDADLGLGRVVRVLRGE